MSPSEKRAFWRAHATRYLKLIAEANFRLARLMEWEFRRQWAAEHFLPCPPPPAGLQEG